uniref:Ribonuclease H-like domain-containing protein n=1 Tax=Tanacetum cinerariifolium TaxID=118510 RepID=A0A699GRB2_TANCI|nr:ribonuclease H-like domain-containing protein [Tanacetum cinerariifolium]
MEDMLLLEETPKLVLLAMYKIEYHLSKVDGKADKSFFVGCSLNSKAFRVFNSRTCIVEENLHIRFSESIPNVVGSGPDWLFDIDTLTRTIYYEPITGDLPFSQDPISYHDDESKPSSDDGKKVNEDLRKESDDNVNSTNNVNIGDNINKLPFDPNMPALEDISIFNFSSDHGDDDAMADMNILDTTIKKEVYVCQPPGFEDLDFFDRVYKIEKALYELHQAPRSWFTEVKTASTPMETQKPLLKDKDGEQVDVHMYRYLKGQPKYGLWYSKDFSFDLVAYTDNDYAGASLDMKSTTGGKAKKSVRLMMEKLFEMELELILVPQPSDPTDNVVNEVVHKELGDSLVRAATTASSLGAEQDIDALNGEEVFVARKNENVVEEVVNDAQVSTVATTVTITTEEITMAQALEALKTVGNYILS